MLALVVVELVVEALIVSELIVVDQRVEIVPVTALSRFVKKLVAARLVDVELLRVALVAVRFVKTPVTPENKFPRKVSE